MHQPLFVVSCERIARRAAYYVRFPINDQLTTRIKELPDETRKWRAIAGAWELTATGLLLLIKKYKNSKKIYFDFGSKDSRKVFIEYVKKIERDEAEKRKHLEVLKKNKELWVNYKAELERNYEEHSERLHSVLKEGIKLYPHQIVASLFMDMTKSTLISHEMGLGKTLSSILYVEMNGFEKVLVITPNSLKFNYHNEVEKFTDSKSHIVNWKKNSHSIEEAKYVIVNYDYFNPSSKKYFETKWKKLGIKVVDAIICDECARLKNTKSNTYKNFKRISKKEFFKDGKVSKIFLSGTPAPNRAYELYTVLNQISPLDFPTKKYFNEYYCGMTYNIGDGWGYAVNTENQRFEELYHKIAPYTHRKRKIDAVDLPEKTYQKIILELDAKEAQIYEEIEDVVANEFISDPTKNPLTIMLRLRQYTASVKVKPLLELINNILETGDKVVIVDYFKNALLELHENLGEVSALHTGDQDSEQRAEVIKRFQDPNDPLKVFLGTIQTCGYGITLTEANKMFIITLPYSVGDYDQVSDRLHRIGQKNIVNIYPLIFKETIDEYVFSAIESKRSEIVKVLDNETYKSDVAESVLSDVIEIIKNKYRK